MENRQIDNKKTKQIRIDSVLHHSLKIQAAKEKTSIKALVERVLVDVIAYTPISLPKQP